MFQVLKAEFLQFKSQQTSNSNPKSQIMQTQRHPPPKSSIPKSISDVDPTSILGTSLQSLLLGDTLQKLNYSSSGSKPQYFIIKTDATLRWATSKSSATTSTPSPPHKYNLSEIRALLYGHVTKTFHKSKKNAQLPPWQCFSILLKNRPFDVFCPDPSQVTRWIYGMGMLVKIYNKDGFC